MRVKRWNGSNHSMISLVAKTNTESVPRSSVPCSMFYALWCAVIVCDLLWSKTTINLQNLMPLNAFRKSVEWACETCNTSIRSFVSACLGLEQHHGTSMSTSLWLKLSLGQISGWKRFENDQHWPTDFDWIWWKLLRTETNTRTPVNILLQWPHHSVVPQYKYRIQ